MRREGRGGEGEKGDGKGGRRGGEEGETVTNPPPKFEKGLARSCDDDVVLVVDVEADGREAWLICEPPAVEVCI